MFFETTRLKSKQHIGIDSFDQKNYILYLPTLYMKKIFILLIAILPFAAFAQITIKGRILNQADTKPLANASVFLSNATNGNKTDADGYFVLQNVKPGKYNMVVSCIGFDKYDQDISIDNSNMVIPAILLFPKRTALKQVTITAKQDLDWLHNYELFKDEFLGTSALSKQCKILNPERLDLTYDKKAGILSASTDDFLIIQNNALGYTIQYLLANFTLNNAGQFTKSFSYYGSVLFEEMDGSPSQKKKWRAKRQEVYEGSLMHFMQAALRNRIDDEGFRVLRLPINTNRPNEDLIQANIRAFTILKKDNKRFRDSLAYWQKKYNLPKFEKKLLPFPLTANELISRTDKKDIYAMGCSFDALYITYDKYHHFNKPFPDTLTSLKNINNSAILFNDPTILFDSNGVVLQPNNITLDGVWARGRMAWLLPLDYEPLH